MSIKDDGPSWALIGGSTASAFALISAITLVGWLLRSVEARIDREVAVESHQYQEARKEAIATLEQDIARLDAEIAKANDDADVVEALRNQRKALENRLERERLKLR